MNQLFRLSSAILDSLHIKDVFDTFEDMYELKIANAPFKEYSIEVSIEFLNKLGRQVCEMENNEDHYPTNWKWSYFFKIAEVGKEDKKKFDHDYVNSITGEKIPEEHKTCLIEAFLKGLNGEGYRSLDECCDYMAFQGHSVEEIKKFRTSNAELSRTIRQILIVLLATRNADKNQLVDKDLARGRYNKSKAYRKDYPITTTITVGKITETHRSEHGGGTVRPHLRRGHIRTQKYGPKYELSKKIFIEPVFVNADEGWIAERRAYNVKAA